MGKKSSVTIRRRMMTNLMFAMVVLSGAIILTTSWGIREAVQRLSRSVIKQTIAQTESELNGFFSPVARQLEIASQWGREGLLDINDRNALNRLFMPLIKNDPQLSSVLLANSKGQEYLLLRDKEKWTNRETSILQWGGKSKLTVWADDIASPVVTWKSLNYNPHKRPWYQGAIATKKNSKTAAAGEPGTIMYWTKPYIFFTTKEPGITASLAFDTPDGIEWVIAFDVLLSDIAKFTMALKVSKHGHVVVLTDDNFRVIGLPRHGMFKDADTIKASLLLTPEELGVPVLMEAMQVYRQQSAKQREAYRVKSDSKIWWVGIQSYTLESERRLFITVVVPESDLLANLRQMRFWILAITLVVLLLAVVNAIFLAKRYSVPIEALVDQTKQISKGNLEPGPPIASRVEEFQRLAEAHDHMREGLRNLLKMERDMQLARQIQQDTFPDFLPKLKGYSIVGWSEPAEEAGGDTYDVIGFRRVSDGSFQLSGKKSADSAFFLLADAVGHGIGPALLVTQVRAMLRIAVRMGWEISSLVEHMNAQICLDLKEGRFISAWIGRLDAIRHRITSFSAGQGPFFHFKAKENDCRIFGANMPPLGITQAAEIVLPEPIVLNPGDLFVVTSDGLIEPSNANGDLFGKERVIEVLKEHHAAPVDEILSTLLKEIELFTQNAPAEDDRTAIIIKREVT